MPSYTLLVTSTYPLPASSSMIFRLSKGGICDRSRVRWLAGKSPILIGDTKFQSYNRFFPGSYLMHWENYLQKRVLLHLQKRSRSTPRRPRPWMACGNLVDTLQPGSPGCQSLRVRRVHPQNSWQHLNDFLFQRKLEELG